MPEKVELKELRIRKIAPAYYSRNDVINALYEFSKNREISPRYFEGFGKRPDSFQYPSDISALVKKGATSFHCSEELWNDPLEISTDLSPEQLNELRNGWDLIIDIDCKWIDYSKKAAQAIIKALAHKGVKNIGVKFSGSKGFHIIIPWNSFPEKLNDLETKKMFPDWPRATINYIKEISRPILAEMIKETASDFKDLEGFSGIKCETCSNLSVENYQINLKCPNCRYAESFRSTGKYKEKKCPQCKAILEESDKTPFYVCQICKLDSLTNPENFNKSIIATDIFKILGLDVLLVSPRHLFRMPYSLHEKTSLASVVIEKNKLDEFNIKDADPLNVKIINFIPQSEKGEAKNLLIQAIDWQKSKDAEKPKITYDEKSDSKKFAPLNLKNLTQEDYPPAIQKILKGMDDGRKRALFILLNFFRSLGQPIEEIEKTVNEWNKKNKPQLKQGYINAQLLWHSKHSPVLPPNFDNAIYKEIGVYEMDSLSEKTKNPVNYVARKIFKKQK